MGKGLNYINNILTYSFKHTKKQNISSEVMSQLTSTDFFTIDCTTNESGLKDTENLLGMIDKRSYKYIIGIGIYSTKNNVIKFEKQAKNQFRNNEAIKGAPQTYQISEFLNIPVDNPNILESTKMGNSWCNMTSFVIRHKLVTTHQIGLNGFIHIPNDEGEIKIYANTIQKVIDTLKWNQN